MLRAWLMIGRSTAETQGVETMPANTENLILGSNMPAWHGAGTVLPDDTFDWETVKIHVPELGYRVDGRPLYAIAEDGKPIAVDDFVANVRADGRILGVVGAGYVPVQGDDAFGFLTALCESGDAIVHTAGTLDRGRKAWIQCLAPEAFRIADEATEEHRGYVTFINSFDGSTKVGAIAGATRVVCENTYNAAIAGAANQYWFKHTADVMARVSEAREALRVGREYWTELQRIAEQAIRAKFSDQQFGAVLDAIIPMPDTTGRKRNNAERERETINDLWRNSVSIANVAHTAWAAVNVWTEFNDHHIESRETTRNSWAENRLKRIWLEPAAKDRAISAIYELAEVR
jgi:phage/plasmid-like protein (TIGR03299 family)